MRKVKEMVVPDLGLEHPVRVPPAELEGNNIAKGVEMTPGGRSKKF